ncbi:MAG: lipopolysaccharide biosynthesis, partial [Symploca sp. SIO2B6]|nr:lipopolysaccharide biosynthesis [Symploca sp. SIO2B6]
RQISTLEARLGLTPDEAYASSALSSDPIIASLRVQIYNTESQLAILSQRLRPEHPEIVALLNQQKAHEELLHQRVEEVIGGHQGIAPLQSTQQIRRDSSLDPARQSLANQLVALQADREHQQELIATQRQLEIDLREEYSQLPNKQIRQAELTRKIALKQTFHNEIQARLADVTLAEKETVGNLVIAQPPKIISVVEEPSNPVVIVAIGSVVGLVVGGALIFLLDSADPTLRMLSDIQTLLREQEVAILGLVPHIPPDDVRPQDMPTITPIDSPYLELFERFRSNLQRSTGKKPPKTVLITSTLPQ